MTSREETDHYRGHPGTEREWKEYAVHLTLTFWAYEGSEQEQAKSLLTMLNKLAVDAFVEPTRPGEYPFGV